MTTQSEANQRPISPTLSRTAQSNQSEPNADKKKVNWTQVCEALKQKNFRNHLTHTIERLTELDMISKLRLRVALEDSGWPLRFRTWDSISQPTRPDHGTWPQEDEQALMCICNNSPLSLERVREKFFASRSDEDLTLKYFELMQRSFDGWGPIKDELLYKLVHQKGRSLGDIAKEVAPMYTAYDLEIIYGQMMERRGLLVDDDGGGLYTE
ncbi:hypothetical protein BS50DRAFT_361998 [Corynespora cassiicola Philippines]|uniref:Uncharacterized protein n=1 Tax=Corynespora cassiicola Philippines TaxID=1448308 RepID=A0A2T2NSE5_CORCC|nr:hypothetical protein BS50DRAFT_361998 [Corynespora cassiicola Philippines]